MNFKHKTLIIISIFCLASIHHYGQTTPQKYQSLLEKVDNRRQEIYQAYQQANQVGKDSLIIISRKYLYTSIIDEVFPLWYGTPWDFNGTSRIPRQGNIACGYFVTNVLTDIGFKIPRIRWAQSASEIFIKRLADHHLKRFTNAPISTIEHQLKTWGNGIYLVGLDSHTGFITVKGDKLRFVHSNYYKADIGIMAEVLDSDNPLHDSNYRVIGQLFSDTMIRHWILGIPYTY